MTTMQCPQCGTQFERGSTEFCPNPNCGYPVAFAEDKEPDIPQVEMVRQPGERDEPRPVAPVVSDAGDPPATTQELPIAKSTPTPRAVPPSDQRRRIAVIAGAVAALLVLGGGLFYLLARNNADAPEFTAEEELTEDVEDAGAVIERIAPESVVASSELVDEENFVAANTIDNHEGTAWKDGIEGPGIGETLTYSFSEPVQLVRVEFVNGLDNSPDVPFEANSRVRGATIGTQARNVDVTLADSFQVQGATVQFGETDTVVVRVNSVYPGTQFDDVALTEVAFFAVRAES
jgi:hypothetical protein